MSRALWRARNESQVRIFLKEGSLKFVRDRQISESSRESSLHLLSGPSFRSRPLRTFQDRPFTK